MGVKDRFDENTLTWALNDSLLHVLWIRHRNNNLKQNNMNELKITIPEGYEIDKANSTFELIKFKKIEKQLPNSLNELKRIHGFYIDSFSGIVELDGEPCMSIRNVFPTKEYAEASLALAQLLQLRQVYNGDWKPDWTKKNCRKYCIYVFSNRIIAESLYEKQVALSFQTSELRDLFMENFSELLEIAKPLL